MTTTRQTVLVLECHRQTLVVMRSLSSAGYRILLGTSEDDLEWGHVPYSNRVDEHWLHPPIDTEPEIFADALLSFLERRDDVDSVFPVGENALRVLADHYEKTARYCKIVMPMPSVVGRCLDKTVAGRIAAKAGVDLPESMEVGSSEALHAAITTIGTPCVIKPLDSRNLLHGRKCLFVDELESLDGWRWPVEHRRLLVQTRVRGNRHNCMFVARDGEIMRYFESEVLRTNYNDYSGYSVLDRSVPPSIVRLEACRRILAELGYSGIGCIQFLFDPDSDVSTFLEINPRLDATLALPIACGLDLPRIALEMDRLKRPRLQNVYRYGRRRYWLYGDWRGLWSDWRKGDVGLASGLIHLLRMLRDSLGADVSTDVFLDDLGPLLRLYGQSWFGLYRRLGLPFGAAMMKHRTVLRHRLNTPPRSKCQDSNPAGHKQTTDR